MRLLPVLLGIAASVLGERAWAADRVSVAAAANLVYALDALDSKFAQANPGVGLTREIGSSGTLVAQIIHGAPYDVFLSADLEYPQKLVDAGGADGSSLATFAIGRLVLWTVRPGLRLSSVAAVVRDSGVRKLAIANPRTAPYGRAAEEALGKLGLSEVAGPKLVFGENITQTAQYVSSGNVDAGFVALSLVLSPRLAGQGRWIEVPGDLYRPLAQGGVLTRRGAGNPAARRYLDFLLGREAGAIFRQFGYRLPK